MPRRDCCPGKVPIRHFGRRCSVTARPRPDPRPRPRRPRAAPPGPAPAPGYSGYAYFRLIRGGPARFIRGTDIRGLMAHPDARIFPMPINLPLGFGELADYAYSE